MYLSGLEYNFRCKSNFFYILFLLHLLYNGFLIKCYKRYLKTETILVFLNFLDSIHIMCVQFYNWFSKMPFDLIQDI